MCQTALSEGSNKEFVDLSSSLIRLSGNPSIIQATFTLPSSLQNPWNLLRSTEKEEKPLICKTTLGIEAEEVTFQTCMSLLSRQGLLCPHWSTKVLYPALMFLVHFKLCPVHKCCHFKPLQIGPQSMPLLCKKTRKGSVSDISKKSFDHFGNMHTFLFYFPWELYNKNSILQKPPSFPLHVSSTKIETRNLLFLFILLYFFKISPRKVKCTQYLFQRL